MEAIGPQLAPCANAMCGPAECCRRRGGGADFERAQVVKHLLRRVAREQSAAVLVVTHDDKIFSRFDRLVSLRDGRIEGEIRPG